MTAQDSKCQISHRDAPGSPHCCQLGLICVNLQKEDTGLQFRHLNLRTKEKGKRTEELNLKRDINNYNVQDVRVLLAYFTTVNILGIVMSERQFWYRDKSSLKKLLNIFTAELVTEGGGQIQLYLTYIGLL